MKDGARVDVEADSAPVGGGSLPGFELETWVVSLRSPRGAARMAAGLRAAATPVLTRIRDDAVLFDLRTVRDEAAAKVLLQEVLLRLCRETVRGETRGLAHGL